MHFSSLQSIPILLFFFFFFFFFISPSFSTHFFRSRNVTFFGDAYFINNSIGLTPESHCISPPLSSASPSSSTSSSSRVGRAFHFYPVRFLDLSTNTTASFSCSFSFTIVPSPSCPFGDGIAFLITSNASSLTLSDGYMGLPVLPQDSQDSFVAVEFDTKFDSSLGDINDNHIGIDVNRIQSLVSVDVKSKGLDLKSRKQITAWIEYRDLQKLFRVWIGYSRVRPPAPIISAQIDLSKQFKEFMHVGFSASNGRGSAVHVVDRWRFKTFGLLSSTLPMDTVGEGDCMICFPGDSNVNRRSTTHRFAENKELEMALGFGGLAAFLVSVIAIFLGFCVCLVKRKRRPRKRRNEAQISAIQKGERVPTRLSLSEIRSATKGFNQHRVIGEGASAVVYEGLLPSFGSVAVKRFSQGLNQTVTMRNPFTTEFATVVGCLRHKNLVQLQGWCCERDELVLVYEYMPNGSLDKILHSRTGAPEFLSWERRFKIVLGVASALIYLHEECERQIIHRDVKSCNIMLDAEFNAKLGDFGLAEVYDHNSAAGTRDATLPAGTMGYLAPEYVYSGVPTVKTDVYSFGVVALEVASGRRPVTECGILISDWVWELWEKGILIEAADRWLKGCFNRTTMERMLMVGLACVHPNHEKRPTMKKAARILRGESPLPLLPARKPTVEIRSALPEGCHEVLKYGEDLDDDSPWATPKTHF